MLTRILTMLPGPRMDDLMISRVDAVASQCCLSDLSTLSSTITKWMRTDTSYHHNTSRYIQLLQTLHRCRQERLQIVDRLDLLLEELKFVSGEWFEDMLVEETMATLQRMMDQINLTHVPDLAAFLTRINHLCPPLMDHIANVVIKDIDKVLKEFSMLNLQ